MRPRLLVAVATVAALAFPVAPAFAATSSSASSTPTTVSSAAAAPAKPTKPAPKPVVITGTVKAIDKAKLTVSITVTVPKKGKKKATTKTVKVRLGARATLTRNDTPATLDVLAVGDTVSVTVTGGKATKVVAAVKGWRTDQVVGTVKKVDAKKRQLIVNSVIKKKTRAVPVKVASNALITARGTVGTLANVVVGDPVTITLGGKGKALNAIRVTTSAPTSKSVRIAGTVISVNVAKGLINLKVKNTKKTAAAKPSAYVIVTLKVGPSDRIIVGGIPTRLADIPVGGVVTVKATETDGSGYDVEDVLVTDDKAEAINLRVVLTSSDRAGGTVTVSPIEDRGDPVTLPIDSSAPITYNGNEASLDDIPANSPATIRVEITATGTTVVALDAVTPRTITMRVVGTLLLVDAVTKRIALKSGDRVGQGQLRTFTVGGDATITRGGAVADLDALKAGDKVAVTVARGTDGKLTATAISATPAPTSKVVVQGVLVGAISGGVVKVAMPTEKGNGLKVRAFSIATDALLTRDGDEVEPSAFEAGDLLTLTLTRVNDDVTVVAIDAAASASAQISVRGRVDSVDTGSSTIGIETDDETTSYGVSGSAKILRNKQAATLADIQEGDKVEAIVRVSGDDSSTVVAINATGRRAERRAIKFAGQVAAIDSEASTLTVTDAESGDDRTVVVGDQTSIRIGEREASLSDVVVGDRVAVIARGVPGGDLNALAIKVMPMRVARLDVTLNDVNVDDSQVQLSVEGRDGDGIWVDVTDMTGLVVDGSPVSLEDLANSVGGSGQAVVVRRGGSWTLTALLLESPSDDAGDEGDDPGQCTVAGDDSGDSSEGTGDDGTDAGFAARVRSTSDAGDEGDGSTDTSGDDCGDPTPPSCDPADGTTGDDSSQGGAFTGRTRAASDAGDDTGSADDPCGDPTPPTCDPTDGATPVNEPGTDPTTDPSTDPCGDPTPPTCDPTDGGLDSGVDPCADPEPTPTDDPGPGPGDLPPAISRG